MRVVVYGLWHLGCVTAVCLAQVGHQVTGLDLDRTIIDGLQEGRPPLFEPGLSELVIAEQSAGRLRFTSEPAEALGDAELLLIAFDTPVNERDEADVAYVRQQLETIADAIQPRTLVLITSQVPVGFTRTLERDWQPRGLRYAYSPENLRLGNAIAAFQKPERVIIGVRDEADQAALAALFRPFSEQIVWMSVESAEMTKHALNAFLATSVTFINELARLCELVGADAKEVERGLKSEGRIGPRAYLAPGAAFAGGTLARDVQFLVGFGQAGHTETPLFSGVLASNEAHKGWTRSKIGALLSGSSAPVVAVLGLTYKPGTSTLRRSASVELCRWLHEQDVQVQAHDPAIDRLPDDLGQIINLVASPAEALSGADIAVIATEWPEYRTLMPELFAAQMRRPQIIDQNWFLAGRLATSPELRYIATGRTGSE